MKTIVHNTSGKILTDLQSVAGIVEKRHTVPILGNLLLKGQGNKLQVTGSDLEIQIQSTVTTAADCEKIETTVNSHKLITLLKTLPSDQETTLQLTEGKLLVKSGRSRFTLQTLPAADYPLFQLDADFGASVSVPQGVLRQLLKRVTFAVAPDDDLRYFLRGVLVVIEAGHLRLVATNGSRLAMAEASVESLNDFERQEVILPRKTAMQLQNMLRDTDESVELRLAAKQVKVRVGSTEIVSKLVEGRFPDYMRVIPQGHIDVMTVNRGEFQLSLQRAQILASEKYNSVRLSLSPNMLGVASNNAESEEVTDEIGVVYGGEDVNTGFNIGFLLDALTTMDHETIEIRSNPRVAGATLLTIPGDTTFKYACMPLKI